MSEKNKYAASVGICIHGVAAEQKLGEETDNLLFRNDAEKGTAKAVGMKIPSKWSKPITAAGNAIRNFLKGTKSEPMSMTGTSPYIIPIHMLTKMWLGLFGHTDISNKTVMGGLIGNFIVQVASLRAACESGELKEEIAKSGKLADQIEAIDCAAIDNRFGVDVMMDVDYESPIIQQVLAQMETDIVEQLESRVKSDAEAKYNKDITDMTDFQTNWIKSTLDTIIEKCGAADAKGTHFKTVLNSIKVLVEQSPLYNVLNDSKITDTVNEIYAKFGTLEKENLKDSKTRTQVAEDARKIMQDFMGINTPAAAAPAAVSVPVSVPAAAAVTDADIFASIPV